MCKKKPCLFHTFSVFFLNGDENRVPNITGRCLNLWTILGRWLKLRFRCIIQRWCIHVGHSLCFSVADLYNRLELLQRRQNYLWPTFCDCLQWDCQKPSRGFFLWAAGNCIEQGGHCGQQGCRTIARIQKWWNFVAKLSSSQGFCLCWGTSSFLFFWTWMNLVIDCWAGYWKWYPTECHEIIFPRGGNIFADNRFEDPGLRFDEKSSGHG